MFSLILSKSFVIAHMYFTSNCTKMDSRSIKKNIKAPMKSNRKGQNTGDIFFLIIGAKKKKKEKVPSRRKNAENTPT